MSETNPFPTAAPVWDLNGRIDLDAVDLVMRRSVVFSTDKTWIRRGLPVWLGTAQLRVATGWDGAATRMRDAMARDGRIRDLIGRIIQTAHDLPFRVECVCTITTDGPDVVIDVDSEAPMIGGPPCPAAPKPETP